MSRLAGDMKGFVVLGVYRSTVKKQNKEKTLLWTACYCYSSANGRQWYECKRITASFVICLHENSQSGKRNVGGTEPDAVPNTLSFITLK